MRATSPFPIAAAALLEDVQLRINLRHATDVIQRKRNAVTAELPDWQQLREAGRALREHTMQHLDFYLQEFERNCNRAGGVVHWARDAAEAREIVLQLTKESLARCDGGTAAEVIKIKSMTTEETEINRALEANGIEVYETDLAELDHSAGA